MRLAKGYNCNGARNEINVSGVKKCIQLDFGRKLKILVVKNKGKKKGRKEQERKIKEYNRIEKGRNEEMMEERNGEGKYGI